MFIVEEMSADNSDYLIIRVKDSNYDLVVQESIPRQMLYGDSEYKYRIIEMLFQKLGREIAHKQLSGIRDYHARTGHWDNTQLGLTPSGQATQTQRPYLVNFTERQRHAITGNLFGQSPLYGGLIFDEAKETKKDNKEEKAMKLLKEKIGKTKYKSLKEKGYFQVKGKHGLYRFMLNDPSGVRLIKHVNFGGKKRRLEMTLCIQTEVPNMPKGDVILARYLSLKADEEKFQKISNFRNVRTPDEAMDATATVSMPSPIRPGSIFNFTTT